MKLPFLKSSKTTEAEVSEKIFGVEINKDLIAQLIKIYIENSHPGTKAQKIDLLLEEVEKNLGVKREQEELGQEHLEALSGVVEELYFLLQLSQQNQKN